MVFNVTFYTILANRTNVGTRINVEYIIISLKEKPKYFQKMLIY
jgi:hypothetical protein